MPSVRSSIDLRPLAAVILGLLALSQPCRAGVPEGGGAAGDGAAGGWAAASTVRSVQDGKTFEELERDVRDEDGRKRRVAVRRLSELRTEEAFELIVEALADEDPQVADEAQLRLAEVPSLEWWREHAFGKRGLQSKDERVRRRVAEALGRAQPVTIEGRELEKALKDKDPTVRRYLLWSLHRGTFVEDKRVALPSAVILRAAEKGKDPLERGAAILAIPRVGWLGFDSADDSAEFLEDALGDREPAVRAAAVQAYEAWFTAVEGALERVASGLRDDHVAVRRAAMHTLGRMGTPEAMEALIEWLAETEDRVDRIWLVELLRRASGRRYGEDPEPWRGWQRDLEADWRAATARGSRSAKDAGEGQDEAPERVTVAELAGLPIQSERIAVLIDMSGSMWTTRDDGRRPKDLVELELNRFLSGLPESAKFNLIPYATEPRPWEDELQSAKPKELAAALEFFERLDLRGQGNVWSAIELALEDEEVDTIVILSDGAPSGGEHWNMELLVDLLLERNRFQHIAFSSILTEPAGNLVPHWQRLADESRGYCRVVEYDELGGDAPAER
jgi:HEAT repeat protein